MWKRKNNVGKIILKNALGNHIMTCQTSKKKLQMLVPKKKIMNAILEKLGNGCFSILADDLAIYRVNNKWLLF